MLSDLIIGGLWALGATIIILIYLPIMQLVQQAKKYMYSEDYYRTSPSHFNVSYKYRYHNLYSCPQCSRLQRLWQILDYEMESGKTACVHCKEEDVDFQQVYSLNYGSWLNKEEDCPRLTFIRFVKFSNRYEKYEQKKIDKCQKKEEVRYQNLKSEATLEDDR